MRTDLQKAIGGYVRVYSVTLENRTTGEKQANELTARQIKYACSHGERVVSKTVKPDAFAVGNL